MVHLPLALALLMPLFAGVAAWAIWTGRLGRRAWVAVAALQLLLVLTSLVAMKTGEREEDRVESVVPDAAMHQHEAYAEQFTWGAALVLGLTLVVFVPAATRSVALVALLGTMAVAGLALRVGHAGGQLVYVHNAGAAYQPASRAAATGAETRGVTTRPPASRRQHQRGENEEAER
jgi:hypothetical protein